MTQISNARFHSRQHDSILIRTALKVFVLDAQSRTNRIAWQTPEDPNQENRERFGRMSPRVLSVKTPGGDPSRKSSTNAADASVHESDPANEIVGPPTREQHHDAENRIMGTARHPWHLAIEESKVRLQTVTAKTRRKQSPCQLRTQGP